MFTKSSFTHDLQKVMELSGQAFENYVVLQHRLLSSFIRQSSAVVSAAPANWTADQPREPRTPEQAYDILLAN